MKKEIPLLVLFLAVGFMTSCIAHNETEPSSNSAAAISGEAEQSTTSELDKSAIEAPVAALEPTLKTNTPEPTEIPITSEEEETMTIQITADGKTFTAELCDNKTAQAFADLLPLKLDMSELNGNEKYYYLDSALPASASRPNDI